MCSDRYTIGTRPYYEESTSFPWCEKVGGLELRNQAQTWHVRHHGAAGVRAHNGRQPVGTGPAFIHNDGERSQVMLRGQSRRGV